jgi:hypothetical protein
MIPPSVTSVRVDLIATIPPLPHLSKTSISSTKTACPEVDKTVVLLRAEVLREFEPRLAIRRTSQLRGISNASSFRQSYVGSEMNKPP